MRASTRTRAVLATAAFLVASWPARADIHSDKAAIQQVYNQSDAAASTNNQRGALARYGDPDLKEYEGETLGSLLAIARSPAFSTQIVAISRPGHSPGEAVVVVTQNFHAFVPRRQGGGIELITYDAKMREYWVKAGPTWTTMRTKLLSIQRTANGKPVSQW